MVLAPTLLGEVVDKMYKKEFHNDFEKFTIKLNLIQFIALVSSIFDINEISIHCKKSGNYNPEQISFPETKNATVNW